MTHSRSTQHSETFMEIPPLEPDDDLDNENVAEFSKRNPSPTRRKDPKGSKEWQMLYSNAISETVREVPYVNQTRKSVSSTPASLPSPRSSAPMPATDWKDLERDLDDEPNLDSLKAVDEQLRKIRQEQEMVAQRAREAEILHKRFDKFLKDRNANLEHLKRDLKMAEQEIALAKDRIEAMNEFSRVLAEHVDVLREIKPELWSNEQKVQYLESSLEVVHAAGERHQEFKQCLRSKGGGRFSKLVMGTGQFEPAPWLALYRSPDFNYWLQMGLAFMLPIILFLGSLALVWYFLK